MIKSDREYRNFEMRALEPEGEAPKKIVRGYATTFENAYVLYDDGEYEIWGGDIDPAAVELARHNAELAEVDDIVKFEVADATRFHWGGLRGRVVTNPPYGERLMEKQEAEELYRAFGKAWNKFPDGWQLYLLSSHTDFERTFGKQADKKRKLYNGMIKCDLFMYGVK